MFRSKRTLLLLLAVAALIGLFAYGTYRLQAAETELEEARQSGLAVESRLAALNHLHEIDSTLYTGAYGDALAAYKAAEANDSLLAGSGLLAPRVAHAEQLISFRIMLDTLRSRRPQLVLNAPAPLPERSLEPVVAADLSKTQPARFDSLTFALKRAETQIRNLQQRLTRSSGPNYLTFKSSEGNEIYYVGEIKGGKAHGNGVALLSTGSRYLGEWRNNARHGDGEFHWTDGAWYEGEYQDDQRSGQGTYHFPQGDVFIGEWEDDVRNGDGVFYDKQGNEVAKGVWKNDELVREQ